MLPEREFVEVPCGHSMPHFYLILRQNYLFRCHVMTRDFVVTTELHRE
jgi:hypothetical protein